MSNSTVNLYTGCNLEITQTGISGLSSNFNTFHNRIEVSSNVFKVSGIDCSIKAWVCGAFKLLNPTEKYLSLNGLTDEQVDAQNDTVLKNIFNLDSEHLCFDKSELEKFFNGEDLKLIAVDPKHAKASINIDEQIWLSICEDIKSFLSKAKVDFKAGSLKAQKAYLELF